VSRTSQEKEDIAERSQGHTRLRMALKISLGVGAGMDFTLHEIEGDRDCRQNSLAALCGHGQDRVEMPQSSSGRCWPGPTGLERREWTHCGRKAGVEVLAGYKANFRPGEPAKP
jgi:hypothetical protein